MPPYSSKYVHCTGVTNWNTSEVTREIQTPPAKIRKALIRCYNTTFTPRTESSFQQFRCEPRAVSIPIELRIVPRTRNPVKFGGLANWRFTVTKQDDKRMPAGLMGPGAISGRASTRFAWQCPVITRPAQSNVEHTPFAQQVFITDAPCKCYGFCAWVYIHTHCGRISNSSFRRLRRDSSSPVTLHATPCPIPRILSPTARKLVYH